MKRFTKYVRDVQAGKIITGELVRRAVARHVRDLGRPDLFFDRKAAQRALDFFTYLKHSKGKEWAGTVFELAGWQVFIVACVFGWKWRASRRRRFRIAYVQVARKNGKTTLGAGVALYLFIADNEPGAEVYTAATKLEQARLCFTEAKRMAASSGLAAELGLDVGVNNIADEATFSKLEPLPADSDSLDGLNTHGCIIDEVHAHKTRELYDVIETSTEARTDPLLFNITTAGVLRICIGKDLRDHSVQVLEEIIPDDEFFAFVAEMDKGDDWRDERVWPKGNPNLGITIDVERLRLKAARAQAMPASQNNFRCKHLDEWTQQAERAIDMARWNSCDAVQLALDGRRCYGGLDLGVVRDLSAFVLLFPPADDSDVWAALSYFWMPGDNVAERVRGDRVPYDRWIADGLIQSTPGNVQDNAFIIEDMRRLAHQYQIIEIGYDPYKALEVVLALQDENIPLEPVRQGHLSMAEPWEKMIGLIESGRLNHGGNAVLRWMASNVVAVRDASENTKPDKRQSFEKIDGIVALLNALARAIQRPDPGVSVYESRGVDSWSG